MMGEPAGWYRDPAPLNPATPTTLRFWDGTQWTTRVKPAPKGVRQVWMAEIAEARRSQAAQRALQPTPAGSSPGPGDVPRMVASTSRDYTPDGQLVAGWWSRAGAVVIDRIVTVALTAVIGWPWLSQIYRAYSAYLNQMVSASQAGSPPPDAAGLFSQIAGPLTTYLMVGLVVSAIYGVGFLKAFAATPGKMALGLQVRLRQHPGPLSWRTVWTRWGAQYGIGVLEVIPVLGILVSIYSWLDDLWPLWDGRRQAVHDKIAKTNVVRRNT